MNTVLASKRSEERIQERAIHLKEFATFKIRSIKRKDHEQCGQLIKELGTNLWYHEKNLTIHLDNDGFPCQEAIR